LTPTGPVLYVLGFLPTYVHREIQELRRRRVDVRVVLPTAYPGSRMWERILAADRPADDPAPVQVDYLTWLEISRAEILGRLARGPARTLARRPARALGFAARSAREGTLRHFLAAAAVAHALGELGVARIHAHFAANAGNVGYWLARWLDVPFTVTVHAHEIFAPQDPARLRRLLRRASRVFTISEFNRGYIEDLLGESLGDRILVTRLGIDPTELPPRAAGTPPPFKIVCTASGLVEKKGLPDLLEACRLLRSRGVAFECSILGSDAAGDRLAALRDRVERDGLGSCVSLPGVLTSRELLSRVATAHAFVHPSVRDRDGDMDGIPVSLMEAMGIGVPVVSTRLSGIPELVADGETGLLVPPHGPQALANALERVLAEPEEAERRALRGRQHLERNFSLARYADQLIEAWRPAG
jgi:glycosyltransferase involved in cell wall biosynthesis